MISVSVIVPTHNRANTLQELLNSLSVQTYSANHFEVLVCSDGSTDNTEDIVSNMHTRLSLRFFETNIFHRFAAAAARNIGIQQSNGELIVFLTIRDSHLFNSVFSFGID